MCPKPPRESVERKRRRWSTRSGASGDVPREERRASYIKKEEFRATAPSPPRPGRTRSTSTSPRHARPWRAPCPPGSRCTARRTPASTGETGTPGSCASRTATWPEGVAVDSDNGTHAAARLMTRPRAERRGRVAHSGLILAPTRARFFQPAFRTPAGSHVINVQSPKSVG